MSLEVRHTLTETETLVSDGALHGSHCDEQPVPTQVERYVIIDKLGHGSMGSVFKAYDPELDRELAVKVLRRRTDAKAVARIVREARAMAQLSHANVVQIYDAGARSGGTFIAMELVVGVNAAVWLQTGPPRAEILGVFLRAARGLQAAHDAGLVHRDFKPSNVLLGDDGRVKVADFGIVGEASGDGECSGGTDASPVEGLDHGLTHADAVVGTPAFMAPEQHIGRVPDARSDQFAFCVSLLGALTGQRPFKAADMGALIARKVARAYTIPRSVPGRVADVIRRGLEPEPEDRFASMDELCRQLQGSRSKGPYAALAVGAAVSAVVALEAFADDVDCTQVGAAADAAWSTAVKDRVAAAFVASDVPYAVESWASAQQQLDRYLDDWRAAKTTVCADAASGQSSPSLHAAQNDCLDVTLTAFEAAIGVLEELDDRSSRALEVVAGLPPPMDCETDPQAADRVRLPAGREQRKEVLAVQAELTRARALAVVGSFERADAVVAAAQARAEPLDYLPLRLEARLAVAGIAGRAGRADESRELLESTYTMASAEGEDRVAAQAAYELAWAYVAGTEELDKAQTWCRHARAIVDRVEGGAPLLRAWVLRVEGRVQMGRDDLDDALRTTEDGLQLIESRAGRVHPTAAFLMEQRALILSRQNKTSEARAAYLEARKAKVENFGAEHPFVGTSDRKLGWLAVGEQEFAVAFEHFERAHRIYLRTYGPDHHRMAESYAGVGIGRMQLGEPEAALPDLHKALALQEAYAGEDSVAVAEKHNYLGVAYKKLDRFDEALRHYHKALQLFESERGTASAAVARLTHNISNLYRSKHEPARARPYERRALEILDASVRRDHPAALDAVEGLGAIAAALGEYDVALEWFERLAADVPDEGRANANAAVGRALVELERPEQARPMLEVSVEELAGTEDSEQQLALARFALARVVYKEDPHRARNLARQAKKALSDADPQLRRVRNWLATH